MKYTLIEEYQTPAVADVLNRLKRARKRWHEDGDKNAFSLTATTGAGKTVMAAAVIEALFFGSDDFDFVADPGAVVIWFSDDPSLNEQSKWRLSQASDKLTVSDLVTVDNSFGRERFEPGKVYFLNTQKLGRNSLLVRGHDPDDAAIEKDGMGERLMPDLRSHTIWDTIKNTIEDPDLTLYLVLDEAHRGMREGGTTGKPTIVKQLINGTRGVPGIPVVWGISATVQRFNDAIAEMEGHVRLPNVIVDAKKVQDSGLIKDTINLDVPDEVGDFATVLLKRGTRNLREISDAWANYAKEQGEPDTVKPLMVLQVPNSPDPNEISIWLDAIYAEWPDLPHDCIANVLGEHRTETFGSRSVPYIEPERVQESDWVRILIAKDAISTGWDCPRAEVMVSLRAASDRTHITQLLGRMVRSPLARRIPGNDRLNAVDCLLPSFDKKSVAAVVNALMSGGETGEDLPLRRVLIRPIEVLPNPDISEVVWDKLLSLPSQTLPKRLARPVKRLTALAHELAHDGLLPDAGKKAHAEMHKVLDDVQTDLAAKISTMRAAVMTVEGQTLTAEVASQGMTFNEFVEVADYAVIEDAYKRAGRIISPDLATTYSEHLAAKDQDAEDEEDALINAHTDVAALGLIPEIKDVLEAAAETLANHWLNEYWDAIAAMIDERQEAYRQIRELSAHPLNVTLARPKVWLQPTMAREANGTEVPLPRYEKHMLCDENGVFPDELNIWERAVLKAETEMDGRVAWYRNPARASQDSLGIVYDDVDEKRIVRPDFVFFSQEPDGGVVADIVDPHGHHLADSLPKLHGLARYAEANGHLYGRIEAVSEVDGRYRVLDLQNEEVRDAVYAAASAKAVYQSKFAESYAA
jgi:type III restriction enzyme